MKNRVSNGSPVSICRMACRCRTGMIPPTKNGTGFPQGRGKDFTFTKCLEPLEPLRKRNNDSGRFIPPGGSEHSRSLECRPIPDGSGDWRFWRIQKQRLVGSGVCRARWGGNPVFVTRHCRPMVGPVLRVVRQTMSFNQNGRPHPGRTSTETNTSTCCLSKATPKRHADWR